MDDILKECNKNLKSFAKINSELSILKEKLDKDLISLHLSLGFTQYLISKKELYLKIPLKDDNYSYCELFFVIGGKYNEYHITLSRGLFKKTTILAVTNYNTIIKFIKQCSTRKFIIASKILTKEYPELTAFCSCFSEELKKKLNKVYALSDKELVEKYKIPKCTEWIVHREYTNHNTEYPIRTNENTKFLDDIKSYIDKYGKPTKFETEDYDEEDEEISLYGDEYTLGTRLKVHFKGGHILNSSDYLIEPE